MINAVCTVLLQLNEVRYRLYLCDLQAEHHRWERLEAQPTFQHQKNPPFIKRRGWRVGFKSPRPSFPAKHTHIYPLGKC